MDLTDAIQEDDPLGYAIGPEWDRTVAHRGTQPRRRPREVRVKNEPSPHRRVRCAKQDSRGCATYRMVVI